MEKLQFESLWEECIQEETRVNNREALLARDDDQALATHTKGGRKKPYFKRESHRDTQPSNKFNNQESHSRNFKKKGQRKGRDSHLYNAIIVIRWDTRRIIVQSEEKSTRGSTKGNMLTLPKMKNHL